MGQYEFTQPENMHNDTAMEPDKKDTNRISLKEFIDDHQKLLAVIGVLVAVSVFFGNNQKLKDISVFISFLCLPATIPLLVEIYKNVNTLKASWLLIIFVNILTPLMAYVAWYLLLAYRPVWKTQTSNVLFWTLIIPSWYLLRHFHIQLKVARLLESLIARALNKLTERTILMSQRRNEKRIAILPDDEKERLQAKEEAENEEFRRRQYIRDSVEAIEDSRVPANILVGLFLFIICNFIAGRAAPFINQRLDRVYESYVAADASPSPAASPSLPPAPSPLPSSSETRSP